jgi:hypothetical protein
MGNSLAKPYLKNDNVFLDIYLQNAFLGTKADRITLKWFRRNFNQVFYRDFQLNTEIFFILLFDNLVRFHFSCLFCFCLEAISLFV